jgi:TonB family protein
MRTVLAAFILLLPLAAQDDSIIQSARTARNPEMLEKRAVELETQYQYDSAQKVLEAALALRGQVNGEQSADYGLCLLKLGALERKTGHGKQATAHYAQAVRLLPGRQETAPVFLYLGITSLHKTDSGGTETEYLERARSLDPTLTGSVLMWTALMHERQDQLEMAEAGYKAALAAVTPLSIQELETRTLLSRFLEQHGRDNEAQLVRPRTPIPGVPGHPAATGSVYKVGGGVSQPMVVYKVDPEYSEEARVAKVSGTVLLQTVIGTDGKAQDIQVLKSFGFGLDDCAITAVSRWNFKPGMKDGSPVPVYATIEVNFRLL